MSAYGICYEKCENDNIITSYNMNENYIYNGILTFQMGSAIVSVNKE